MNLTNGEIKKKFKFFLEKGNYFINYFILFYFILENQEIWEV
jgi:hypothetical protein